MIIGVDGNEANVKMKVGVSVYAFNLLHYFRKRADNDISFKIFLKDKPLDGLPSENRHFQYTVIKGKFLWSQIFLPLTLYFKKNINVFFTPAHYAPRFCPVPYVVTIHDLSYFYFPDEFLKQDLYKLKNWTRYSITNAKKIIAVSNSTKKDILKNYSLDEKKIDVVYNGYERAKLKAVKFKRKNVDKPYILYVGTLQPRKNIPTLITVFGKFLHFYPDFELYIVGKKGWLYQKIFDQVAETGLTDKVHFTDYVTDEQLAFLYQSAFCLVMPSFYEGFGIPLLEAMSYGCPVISSFSSSLPEVGGDSCLYFDPGNVDDLLEKMKTLKEDKNLKQELIKKGKERLKFFSWKTCGEETLNIIKSVVF